jgi:hypothetical protein
VRSEDGNGDGGPAAEPARHCERAERPGQSLCVINVPYFNSNESVFEAFFIGSAKSSLHGHRTCGIFIYAFGNAVVPGSLAGIPRKEVQLTGTISERARYR